MKKAKKSKKSSVHTRPQEVSDLLRKALQQPGVKELMEVYENWKTLDNIAQPHRRFMGVRRIVSASNNSEPVIR